MNIYYLNVNYSCNNRCKFCFSHNTYFSAKCDLAPSSLFSAIEKCKIGARDRVIINGGEPTVHPAFKEILEALFLTGAEIVIYSNGRLLKNDELCLYVLERISRIVIPIHGNQAVHDMITQADGAFADTEQAINKIAKSPFADKLELKFIVTEPMIKSGFSVFEFLKSHGVLGNPVVISGLVNTKVATLHPGLIPKDSAAGEYIENTIREILPYAGGIKLMDFPLCKLSDDFLSLLNELPDTSREIAYTYYFIDAHYPDGKIIGYHRQKSGLECKECTIKKYCTSVLDSCLVLALNKNEKTIVLE